MGLFLAVSAMSAPSFGQSTEKNLAKYVRLRQRLLDEFTVIGDGPGESQPAVQRHDTNGYIKWADSTISLGWYIGVLATEQYILSHSELFPGADGGDSSKLVATRAELGHALGAMERLDQVAETAPFTAPCGTAAPALNGFFLRDDVPADFHTHFAPLTSTQSDFIDPALNNKEMSQDQVYHVLLGLALVKALVPEGTAVAGHDLRVWAVQQATRIGKHVADHNWVIYNPVCDRPVERGPLAAGYSGGTRQALGFITDGALVPDTAPALIDLWNAANNPDAAPYIKADNLHMAMAIAAVGNGWGDTTAADLSKLADKQDWPLYPLLHRALHGDAASGWCATGGKINTRARQMLDELPDDGEPAHPSSGPAPHGFTTSNHFIRPKDQAYVGSPGCEGLRYVGLDYLLLFNLYAIATPATWAGSSGPGVPECGATGGSGGTSGSGGAPSGGAAGAGGPTADGSDDSGCGCRSGRGSSGSALAAAFIALLAALGTRRSRVAERRRG